MSQFKKIVLLWLAILLVLPFQTQSYAAPSTSSNLNTSTADSVTGFVRLKNKWKSNYLYEDSSGIVRYGFTNITDPTSQWQIEAVPGTEGFKRLKNRATGHYITIANVAKRKDALTSRDIQTSSTMDQWIIKDASRVGYTTIQSATNPGTNLFIHEEDQLGFAEVSSDIGAAWESPQWMLEPASEMEPVRILNQYRAGQYLFENKDGVVEFGKMPTNDQTSHWYVEIKTENNGTPIVRLKNRATGHYITQGTLWAPIKSLNLNRSTKNEWIMAAGTSSNWVTFTNVYALGTDRIANDPDEIDAGSVSYVLNTQFDDTSARSNNWSNASKDNAQWKLEMASDVPPVRIAGYTDQTISQTYLYEDQGTVKYGSLGAGSVTNAVYQWLVEDYNGKKRFRNLATGNYVSMQNAVHASDPLQSLNLPSSSTSDQWIVANSNQYDDYVTVQSAVYSSHYINMKDGQGFAQSAAINPMMDAAQWLFEDPSAAAGGVQYVQIQSEWQSLVLYEDEQGNLKYGNAKQDDQRAQWLIEKYAGRKRIKNHATGHYINMQDMSSGHIKVTNVEDSWTSAIWVIETLDGGAKLIHSVKDSNNDPNHQTFIHLQNLTKFAEYGEINRNWGSPHWKFVNVTDDSVNYFLLKNKDTNTYLFEEKKANEENGKTKYGNPDVTDANAHWFMESAGGGPQYIRNRATGHYMAMEGIDPANDTQKDPLKSMFVDLSWGIASPKWYIEDAQTPGYKVFRSGWTGEHYVNEKDHTGYAQANKNVAAQDSAQFKLEIAPSLPLSLPQGHIRIKNSANGKYLYENNKGIVMYGTPAENNGYSQWIIETSSGIQRLKNVATGHYMAMNTDYAYIESVEAANVGSAAQWVIESNTGGTSYLIRSNHSSFNDEYVNVQNGVGYPERGLYPNSFGTLQWIFETTTQEAQVPPSNEVRNLNTSTKVFDDSNYVRIYNRASKQYLVEQAGQISLVSEAQNESAQWLLQDFNGRKLIKNRATGHLISANSPGQSITSRDDNKSNLRSQWTIEDDLGYKKISSPAGPILYLYEEDGTAKAGTTNTHQDRVQWMVEPVAGDAVYEAENAFVAGGAAVSSVSNNFSGTGYIDQFVNIGAKAIFAVNAQTAGSYSATIRYSNPSTVSKTLSLYVNGLTVQQLAFGATESGDSWKELTVSLPLRAGYNSVSLELQSADSGHIAIDSLTVHHAVNKAYRGSIEPYTTYEAEHADTNGLIIGPTRVYHEMASEASGRQAVRLDQTGQYVQFALAKPANSIVLRYSVADSVYGDGINTTLGLYVNDMKVKDLQLTSKYAWEYGNYPWSNDPSQGSAHRFFDEVHALIGEVPAGAVIKLQKDAASTADAYIIDFAEMEQAPTAAYERPVGFVSITEFGAVPDDGQDDSQAFKDAMAAAKAQHKGVWFPAGTFEMNNGSMYFLLDDITIRGAGMWYTTLKGAKFFGNGSHIRVYDLAIDGELNIRDDAVHTNGFEGAFGTGSTIQSVWIEHTKTAMWIARPKQEFGLNSDNFTNEFYVAGLRMRNLMADGINFSINTKNSMVEQSNVRYAGDDGLAMWSTLTEGYPSDYTENNTFRFDTVQLPWLADNMVVFGGKNNKMQDNILTDTIGLGGGIAVSTRFSPVTDLDGTTRVERNTLIRTGSRDAGLNLNFGAIWIYADTKPIHSSVIVKDNIALDSTYQGVSIQGTSPLSNVTFEDMVIDGAGTSGFEIASTISGSLTVDNVIIRNARLGDVANNAGENVSMLEIHDGFASMKKPTIPNPSDPDTGSYANPMPTTSPGITKLDDKMFDNAIAANEKKIVVEADSSKSSAWVEISGSTLLKAAKQMPKAEIVIKFQNVSYTLPINIELIAANNDLQLDFANSTVLIKIEKVDSTTAEAIKKNAQSANMQLLDTPIRFEILLQAGDKQDEIKHFGQIYVTRTITVDGILDNKSTTAVIYNPETGEFRYVPAIIASEGGKTKVTIESTSNSIYTIAKSQKTFGDIQTHWAKTEIELLASKLIVNGRADSNFAPDQNVTRAEFAALLVRSLGLSLKSSTTINFKDVTAKDWYYNSVLTAAGYGIVNGYDTGTFAPDQTITREQMAVMVARAMKLHTSDPKLLTGNSARLSLFEDAGSISSWAKDALEKVLSYGVMQGKASKVLAPGDLATRAESVVVLLRTLQAMNLINK
ncbi:S-layer homology domain-containing protein [Paenibacillus alginolyticus]|uniref:S-layer homology domain-containing protein n=1 Tax=Paenibacillus alginolyticus TaxID=59839 RepID=A0ABT4GKS1_9BACL|nr:S-layer homology domain-containing protein [Paenibacillus alginolyticus]MCY9696807.1 S-layer homology domain-containing protein [Paenibacillus alginolyticus]MEC0147679.1 S-layer homology domain-containing protein [Paenibacillus alginolyticus]